MNKSLPCMRDVCIGKSCQNFGDKGCKGGEHPPWSYAKWYLETFGTATSKGDKNANA